ncbi:MAG: energy transducer TonB [Flavobacterium sp.]|uniref:energy transducer TonB n=1 Tax=Flavobacterium sp. TaxID=239 RepID=UPI003265C766
MSNVSIYEKNWIDLVFEDKNKVYGAYQLRQENPRTTLFAFLSGITLILSLLGGWLLFSSFGEKPILKPTDGPVITITSFNYPKPNKPIVPKTKTEQSAAAASENKFKKYEASTTPDVEVPKKTETPSTPVTSGSGTETGPVIDIPTGGGNTTGTTVFVPLVDKGPVAPSELDRLPEYPGTIKKFYKDVADNFEKPDSDETLGAVSVIMSFVIEKDGTMSNIKVLRSSDKSMEKEAIRVLKAMKVKWSPGYKDGEKMRVLYTLPIKVAF